MADDQIGLDVGPRFKRVVNRVGVPGAVFKSSAAIVGFLPSAAFDVILDPLDLPGPSRRLLRNEGATEPLQPRQIVGQVAKLRGEVLMNENHVHDGDSC